MSKIDRPFKVGDYVLVKADKSGDSMKFNGKVCQILSMHRNYCTVEYGSISGDTGVWLDEITLILLNINDMYEDVV